MKKKSLKTNAILSGIQKLFSILFPLITFPYITRVLQVDTIGKINFVKSIISYATLLAGLGITNYAIREGARLKDNKDKLNIFCNQMFSINLLSTIISYIILISLCFLIPKMKTYFEIMLIESFTIIGTTIGINWLYSIYEEYAYITIRTIIFQFLSLILMFLFVKNQDDGLIYVFVTVLASVGSNIFNLVHSRKYIKLRITTNLDLKKHIKPIMIIFASSIAISIYVNSDITILGFLKGDYYVGIYSISVRIYTIVKQLVASMIVVSLPRVSEYLSNKQNDKYISTVSMLFSFLLSFTIPIAVGIVATSKYIVTIISGDSYLTASNSLSILSISLIFAILASLITYTCLLPNKLDKLQLTSTIVSALVNIVLNFILIPYLCEIGAAITTLLAEIIVFLISIIGFYRYYDKDAFRKMFKVDSNTIISIFIGNIGIVLITAIVNKLIVNIFLAALLDISLSVCFYFIVIVLFKNQGLLFFKNKSS